VVAEGVTPTEPLAETTPTPLSMDTDVAFAVDQVSVLELPTPMVVGLADMDAVGG